LATVAMHTTTTTDKRTKGMRKYDQGIDVISTSGVELKL